MGDELTLMVKTQAKKDRDRAERRLYGLHRRLCREAGYDGPFPPISSTLEQLGVPSLELLATEIEQGLWDGDDARGENEEPTTWNADPHPPSSDHSVVIGGLLPAPRVQRIR